MNEPSPFPVAEIATRSSIRKASRLWWLTGVCLVIAAVLVWSSMKPAGIALTISFDDGHGLKVGDKIRHRGIEIGHVVNIRLADDMSGIKVEAILDHDASSVATQGARFWIVRPRIEVSGVSGLDTAVGPKYIRVIPSPQANSGDAIAQRTFRGLASQPADADGEIGGLELVLRAAHRHGIHESAPVTWRGVQVGRVLSTNLSPNSLTVDIRVRIDEGYRRLIRSSSKFWATSGIDIDLGVTGMEVSAESLATIVRGGISVITLDADNTSAVNNGDVFRLLDEGAEEWLKQAPAINLMDFNPVATVPVVATWRESFLGIAREKKSEASAWVTAVNGEAQAIIPVDMLTAPKSAIEESFMAKFQIAKQSAPISIDEPPSRWGGDDSLLAKVPYPSPNPLPGGRVVLAERMRTPTQTEDCFVVRGEAENTTMQWLGRESLSLGDRRWNVAGVELSRSMWHGSPVIAASDQFVIGVLLLDSSGAQVVPLP
ncbi:Paraquat-inducible protein B [Rubripirellula amarantea]|uniref:Paraquat-inducible protein B n=1 Tax=Rubripirellula amarantea TaxID=2527999 RepID=A0A5C5WXC5_9BACT|nr:MlaD family protein [Rubripirellula amarantea]TWT54522.1 Paraquat-inducible protein B [Rubripirellula amarantea]